MSGRARFRLLPLDHPATPADVQVGRALFSLAGTTRVWKMPVYPLGPVWQAEEVLVDGQWKRYYGLLKDGRPATVPASEMSFAGNYSWSGEVIKGISGTLDEPGERDEQNYLLMYRMRRFLPAGAPVPVRVSLRNHGGLEQTLPSSLILPPGAARALPGGVGFAVSYSPKLPPLVDRFPTPEFDYGTFQEVPLRGEVAIGKELAAGPTLYPTQELTILNVDLRDYFDVSRPGSYRVKALFHVPSQPAGQSNEITLFITGSAH